MNRKLALLMSWVIVLICIIVHATVSAEISVGVKAGDWIEYNFVFTGTPPYSPYPTWARIEVKSVQGTTVIITVTVKYSDGTQETDPLTEDLETGVSDLFIIPANSNNGDTFYHKGGYGNMTISRVEERTCAGAKRTVVYANASQIELYWDKTTGVFVEEYQWGDSYTMTVKSDKTNMWQAEFWFPIDPALFYVLIIVAIAIVVTVAFFIIRRRRKSTKK